MHGVRHAILQLGLKNCRIACLTPFTDPVHFLASIQGCNSLGIILLDMMNFHRLETFNNLFSVKVFKNLVETLFGIKGS